MTDTTWGPDSRPRRNPEAAFREYEGESVVILPSGAEVNVLNASGGLIFHLLDGSHTVSDLVQAVCREYDVDAEQAGADVHEFLQALQTHGMLG